MAFDDYFQNQQKILKQIQDENRLREKQEKRIENLTKLYEKLGLSADDAGEAAKRLLETQKKAAEASEKAAKEALEAQQSISNQLKEQNEDLKSRQKTIDKLAASSDKYHNDLAKDLQKELDYEKKNLKETGKRIGQLKKAKLSTEEISKVIDKQEEKTSLLAQAWEKYGGTITNITSAFSAGAVVTKMYNNRVEDTRAGLEQLTRTGELFARGGLSGGQLDIFNPFSSGSGLDNIRSRFREIRRAVTDVGLSYGMTEDEAREFNVALRKQVRPINQSAAEYRAFANDILGLSNRLGVDSQRALELMANQVRNSGMSSEEARSSFRLFAFQVGETVNQFNKLKEGSGSAIRLYRDELANAVMDVSDTLGVTTLQAPGAVAGITKMIAAFRNAGESMDEAKESATKLFGAIKTAAPVIQFDVLEQFTSAFKDVENASKEEKLKVLADFGFNEKDLKMLERSYELSKKGPKQDMMLAADIFTDIAKNNSNILERTLEAGEEYAGSSGARGAAQLLGVEATDIEKYRAGIVDFETLKDPLDIQAKRANQQAKFEEQIVKDGIKDSDPVRYWRKQIFNVLENSEDIQNAILTGILAWKGMSLLGSAGKFSIARELLSGGMAGGAAKGAGAVAAGGKMLPLITSLAGAAIPVILAGAGGMALGRWVDETFGFSKSVTDSTRKQIKERSDKEIAAANESLKTFSRQDTDKKLEEISKALREGKLTPEQRAEAKYMLSQERQAGGHNYLTGARGMLEQAANQAVPFLADPTQHVPADNYVEPLSVMQTKHNSRLGKADVKRNGMVNISVPVGPAVATLNGMSMQ